MNNVKLENLITEVEELMKSKQENGTIKSVNDEALFLCGAMQVIHLLYSENKEKLDSIPPRWIFSPMSSRSINEFNYAEEKWK